MRQTRTSRPRPANPAVLLNAPPDRQVQFVGFRRNGEFSEGSRVVSGRPESREVRRNIVIRKFLIVAAFAAFAMPAFAFHCPADIAKINAALETEKLTEDQRAKVILLRDVGQVLHDAGDHDASVKKLAEAMAILGI
jgi:hypothetical protein